MNALKKKLAAMGLSSALILSGAFLVAPWEGKENKAYLDVVGVYTICYGSTSGVKKGDYKTDEQCLESLAEELSIHNDKMLRYVKVPLADYQQAAFLSFTYNVGVGAFSKSTLLKKLNNRDYIGACNELLRWNKAGGKVYNGLTRRREAERKVCLGEIPK
jgi:lysozyme